MNCRRFPCPVALRVSTRLLGPAHFVECVQHHDHRTHHREDVLQQVGDDHAPEAGHRGVDEGDENDRHDRPQPRIAREPAESVEQAQCHDHLPHRQHPVADTDAVERHGEEKRAERSQRHRRSASVPDLRQLQIGDHVRAPPELRQDHGEEHVGECEAPPLPVSSDPGLRHPAGDVERRVDVERRGRHGGRGEPPGDRPPADEELGHVLRPTPCHIEAEAKRGYEVGGDDEPVEEAHRGGQ